MDCIQFKKCIFQPILCLFFFILTNYAADVAAKTADVQIAIGSYSLSNDQSKNPLFLRSEDQGQNWSFVKQISGFPLTNFLNMGLVSCESNTCVAAGDYDLYKPLLANSIDYGQSWSFTNNITNLPSFNDIVFQGLSCTSRTCVAVGWIVIPPGYGTLLVISKDHGHTWSYITPPSSLTDADLLDVSCLDNSCFAVGEDISSPSPPCLLTSQNGGEAWLSLALDEIANLPVMRSGIFHSIHCEDNNCVIAGSYRPMDASSSLPLLIVSKDRGKLWTSIKIPSLSHLEGSSINKVNCQENLCIAAGTQHIQNKNVGLILISSDHGESWVQAKDMSKPSHLIDLTISSLSCLKNKCTVAGYYLKDKLAHPLLLSVYSKNQIWSFTQSIATLPEMNYGSLSTVQCNEEHCLAAGSYTTIDNMTKFLLLNSQDGGQTWSALNGIPDLPIPMEYSTINALSKNISNVEHGES